MLISPEGVALAYVVFTLGARTASSELGMTACVMEF